MDITLIVWGGLLLALLIAEAVTVGLVCIWFAGGALAALLAAGLHASLWLQIALFLLVSGALLLCVRPMTQRWFNAKRVATNVDALIGRIAIVCEPIDPLLGTGRVKVSGVDWTARTVGDAVIPVNTKVRIVQIEGVKVCVEPLAVPAEV